MSVGCVMSSGIEKCGNNDLKAVWKCSKIDRLDVY